MGKRTDHLTDEQKDEYKLRQERVVRWDKYRIEQMSFTNNLFIGFSIAFLSFFVTKTELTFHRCSLLCCIQILTVVFVGLSFLSGTLLTINRLKDFRQTARLTKRKKRKYEHENNIECSKNIRRLKYQIVKLKRETNELGENTWCFLRCQVWTFFAGVITGVLYLMLSQTQPTG
ncbi:MAG: hypothetical protein WDA06_15285 [Phenylobacterium sp.]|jgi:hypothetical protein